ncbi:MAG: hypothetical protein H7X95_07010, partial [Deltaproteobacteria bacterium]|nr:hypothetical protein [Deltaproteobacteria bacterium]
MSLKRSNSGGRGFGGAGDAGGKVDRQELFDELKRLAAAGDAFTPVDIALAIGAGEPLVSKSLLGLAAEGYLERVEGGQYRATPMVEMTQAEFVKAYARASKVDSTRQRDLSEIGRLKQNNDVMRQRLLTAIAERDHYLGILKARGIDPGTPPSVGANPVSDVAPAPALPGRASSASEASDGDVKAAPGAAGLAVPSPASESERLPSGPGDAGPVGSGS